MWHGGTHAILQSSPQHGVKHPRRHQQHDNLTREISVSGTEYLTRPGLEMKLVLQFLEC